MAKNKIGFGIDIGGSGIKGAPVDLHKGEFADKRLRIDTPQPSTPESVADVVAEIVHHFRHDIGKATIGITIPGVVTHGVVRTAANIDHGWLECEGEKLFAKKLKRDVVLINDADAAGVAEDRYGAAKKVDGLVLLTTLGTGIGSALINNGVLVPNTEFGHLEIDGVDAESRAASSAKEREDLSYEEYAKRLQRYYEVVEALVWPDLILVGGGISKDADQFLPLLKLKTPIKAAELRNTAGIVGAAAVAADR